jgi:hypothetical protein
MPRWHPVNKDLEGFEVLSCSLDEQSLRGPKKEKKGLSQLYAADNGQAYEVNKIRGACMA